MNVRTEMRNGLGVVMLNRPEALNALSLDMLRHVAKQLDAWRTNDTIEVVLMRGALQEGKGVAFCAGGDIRFFHGAAQVDDPRIDEFFTEEYTLDHTVHHYPKPIVAWMDGVVMGGGMGLAQGASLRIVTERTKMAMPETAIGLFPDVGGGWFLSRCPGHLGEYLALTGHIIGAGDALYAGLADGFMPSENVGALTYTLAHTGVDGANELAELPPPSLLHEHRDAIDRHFAHDTVQAIVKSLQGDDSTWAQDTLAALLQRSPLMLCVTLEQLRRGRRMSLADDLRMERDLVWNCFNLRKGLASETVEGIRALVIDKDKKPRWNPARLDDVTPEQVAAFFQSPWTKENHPLHGLS
jgi:enoyl-CoA hydratase/carnithine racemase